MTDNFPEPKIATDEEFDKFIKAAENSEGFEQKYDKNGIQIWSKESKDSRINLVKMRTIFEDIQPEVVYDVLHDPDYRKVWDDHMIEGYEIEKLDKNNDVGYYSARFPTGISNRDFCNERSWRVRDGEWVIMNHTVKHPKMPERRGFVRANSILTGYYLKYFNPEQKKGTILVYLTQTDLNGWIPAWLINKATTTLAPSISERLRVVCREYPEWKKKNNPETKPWLN